MAKKAAAADQPDTQEPAPFEADGEAQAVETQADKDAAKPTLAKEDALQLLKAGHRLRFRGDDPMNWVAMSRHAGDLVISYPVRDIEAQVDALASQGDLLLAD